MRGIKINESERNFLHGDTSHITPHPIALTTKFIKVVPSYFSGGVQNILNIDLNDIPESAKCTLAWESPHQKISLENIEAYIES